MRTERYRELVETLKADILSGKYKADQRFPSVRAIVLKHKVSSVTVHRALAELTRQGLVDSRQGTGTFVTRLGTSRNLGLIAPGIVDSDVMLRIVTELNRLAQQAGYTVVAADMSAKSPKERAQAALRFADDLVMSNVAGVVFQPFEHFSGADAFNERIVAKFKSVNVPVVLVGCDIDRDDVRGKCDVVGVNGNDAGYRLGRHLLNSGSKNVTIISRPNSALSARNAENGVINAIISGGGGRIYANIAPLSSSRMMLTH